MRPTYQWFDVKQPRTRHFWRRVRLVCLRHPRICVVACIITLLLLYLSYQLLLYSPHSHDEYDGQLKEMLNTSNCSVMNNITQLAFGAFVRRLVNTLDMLDVTYFLCYDTLWSVLLRDNAASKNRLPRLSDACLNLCVLNEDITNHEESIILRRFRSAFISIRYNHGDGLYIMKPIPSVDRPTNEDLLMYPELSHIHARLHVFERDSIQTDMYRRIGWRSRMLPSTLCSRVHCFPAHLVAVRPLPKITLLPNLELNVPHEGVELQKYHYPNSWWTIASSNPDDCQY